MRLDLTCRDVDYNRTVLAWNVEAELNDNINSFGYIIEISESPEGPWTSVNKTPIYNAYGYLDTTTQRGMVDQRLYYRVTAIGPSGKQFSSQPICLFDEEQNYLTKYIARQERLLLNRYNGQEALLFARKKFGTRCHVCYSDIDRKITRSKCPVCFGTTYEGGYYMPVRIRVNVDVQAKSVNRDETGAHENEGLTGWTSNEIIIESLDVLVFMQKNSERYLVQTVVPTSIKNATVRQMLTLNRLRLDDPAQQLLADTEAYTLDEFNVFRREWRQFR